VADADPLGDSDLLVVNTLESPRPLVDVIDSCVPEHARAILLRTPKELRAHQVDQAAGNVVNPDAKVSGCGRFPPWQPLMQPEDQI
jgi:hypothetical protein